jgi:hypothetical protein
MIDFVGIGSLLVAVIALWVAWDTRRKSTQHIVRVLEVANGHERSVEHPQGSHYFHIYFRNIGLAFPTMWVSLGFREKDGKGWVSCPLEAIDILTGQSHPCATGVATGLVVKFGLQSYNMNDMQLRFLRLLSDLGKQEAILTVYCAGYRVTTVAASGWRERTKESIWRMSHAILRKMGIGYYASNQESRRSRISIPKIKLVSLALKGFIQGLPEETGNVQRKQM